MNIFQTFDNVIDMTKTVITTDFFKPVVNEENVFLPKKKKEKKKAKKETNSKKLIDYR